MTRLLQRGQTPLRRWELVGAWLGIWTAPRDVEIPPIPWRKVGLWALGLLVVIGVALALLIPPLEHGKKLGAERLAAEQARAAAALAAQLRLDQAVHRSSFSGAAKPALEAAITADAEARVTAHRLAGPIASTKCDYSGASVIIYPHSRVYRCFVTSKDMRGEGHDVLATGYPFVGTVYYATHRLAWCKLNPQPGEKTRGKGLAHVVLSNECAGKLSEVL